MNTESTKPEQHRTSKDSQQKDESLEELAGELLGVNLNASSDSSGDVSLDDLDWGELEFASSESREIGVEAEEEKTRETAKSIENDAPLDQSDDEEFDEPVGVSNEEDDPLAAWDNSDDDWNWDENKKKSQEPDDRKTVPQTDSKDEPENAVESRTSSVGLSSKDEDPETAEDFISEYDGDNPFGLGLFGEEAEDSDRPRKRTRKKKEPALKEEESETIESDESLQAEDVFEETTEPMEEGDDFGADLDLDDERPRTRRKKKTPTVKKTTAANRNKSSERKPKELERDSKKKTTDSVGDKRDPQHPKKDREETDPTDAPALKTDYRDIPSWEEAISYLLKPSLVGVEKDDSSPSGKPAPKKQVRQSAGRTKTAPRKRKRRR